MQVLSIPYSDDLLVSTGKSKEALEQELRFLLAVKLFELRRLSLGKAAELCGMHKINFIAFNLPPFFKGMDMPIHYRNYIIVLFLLGLILYPIFQIHQVFHQSLLCLLGCFLICMFLLLYLY